MAKDVPLTKRCSGCGRDRSVGEFYVRNRRSGALYSWCKSCHCSNVAGRRKEAYYKAKRKAFDHYGWACVCCGDSNEVFLTLDHIGGGGTQHRQMARASNAYEWVVKNGFPEGFRVLCHNCNWAMHVLKGHCPHRSNS